VREAETFLERSKDAGRNRVGALTEKPVSWERFAERLSDAKWIHEQLQGDSPVSTGFIYRILQIAEDAEKVALHGHIGKAGWRARLADHLARNLHARDKNQKEQRITDWLEHLGLDDQFRLIGDHPNIHDWRLPLTITLYRNRT
jgi:CRISPR-associated protein Csm1